MRRTAGGLLQPTTRERVCVRRSHDREQDVVGGNYHRHGWIECPVAIEAKGCGQHAHNQSKRHPDDQCHGAPLESPCAFLDITLFQQGTQIVRNWHGLHGADIGAAGVSNWHPYAREHCRRHDSRRLANDLAPGALRSPESKHEPMYANMLRRVTLTEDVGALR